MPIIPIPLTGTGGLFTRIGAYGGLLNAINASRGTTIPSHVASIQAQYQTTDQNIIDNLYTNESQYQNACSAFNSPIKQQCTNTVIQMANESLLLNNKSLSAALTLLISQMQAASQTVNQCVISSSVVYSSSNVGNPVLACSLKDANGLLCEYTFAELCTGTVTADSQQSASLAGIEGFNLKGQYSINDTFSYLYPEGSGSSLNLNAVSGLIGGGGGTGNWLVNGSMETWSPTSNGIPTSWHLGVGTPGTTIIQSSSPIYDGLYALEFAGNGSELTALYQRFSTPAANYDTNSLIFPNSIFVCNFFIRMNATPASGVLQVSLSNGTSTINDNSGTPNLFSVNLNTISTTWVPVTCFFRTPNQLPPNVSLLIGLTTALPSGKNLYIDRVCFTQPTRMYNGGPFISLFSGNINMIRGDQVWLTLANAYNGQFQILFNKLFGMAALGMILPSSVSPTISDSLIA